MSDDKQETENFVLGNDKIGMSTEQVRERIEKLRETHSKTVFENEFVSINDIDDEENKVTYADMKVSKCPIDTEVIGQALASTLEAMPHEFHGMLSVLVGEELLTNTEQLSEVMDNKNYGMAFRIMNATFFAMLMVRYIDLYGQKYGCAENYSTQTSKDLLCDTMSRGLQRLGRTGFGGIGVVVSSREVMKQGIEMAKVEGAPQNVIHAAVNGKHKILTDYLNKVMADQKAASGK